MTTKTRRAKSEERQTPTTTRPAGQGSSCDAFHRNPDPDSDTRLVRCGRRATYRLVLAGNPPQTVKRCDFCRQELLKRAGSYAVLEERRIVSRDPWEGRRGGR